MERLDKGAKFKTGGASRLSTTAVNFGIRERSIERIYPMINDEIDSVNNHQLQATSYSATLVNSSTGILPLQVVCSIRQPRSDGSP